MEEKLEKGIGKEGRRALPQIKFLGTPLAVIGHIAHPSLR